MRSRPLRIEALIAALPRPLVPAGAARLLPTRRSFAAGLALVAVGGAVYAFAAHSATFAIRHIVVRGAQPLVRAQVRRELTTLRGTNLLRLDGGALERRVESLPNIVSATYDRAFPHTLRITVAAERPVAVLHRGADTWLVSAASRVLRRIAPGTRSGLPRVWVPRATTIAEGDFLEPASGGIATQAVALAGRLPARISTAVVARGELVLRLRSGVTVLLGDPTDVRLKLAIARRTLALLPSGATYLDVSVPGRPVAGTAAAPVTITHPSVRPPRLTLNSQVQVDTQMGKPPIDRHIDRAYPAARTLSIHHNPLVKVQVWAP